MIENKNTKESGKDLCRDCGVEISKHNLYLHAGLCDDCFFKMVDKAEETEDEDYLEETENLELPSKIKPKKM